MQDDANSRDLILKVCYQRFSDGFLWGRLSATFNRAKCTPTPPSQKKKKKERRKKERKKERKISFDIRLFLSSHHSTSDVLIVLPEEGLVCRVYSTRSVYLPQLKAYSLHSIQVATRTLLC